MKAGQGVKGWGGREKVSKHGIRRRMKGFFYIFKKRRLLRRAGSRAIAVGGGTKVRPYSRHDTMQARSKKSRVERYHCQNVLVLCDSRHYDEEEEERGHQLNMLLSNHRHTPYYFLSAMHLRWFMQTQINHRTAVGLNVAL